MKTKTRIKAGRIAVNHNETLVHASSQAVRFGSRITTLAPGTLFFAATRQSSQKAALMSAYRKIKRPFPPRGRRPAGDYGRVE
jgi:hypothetical protein